MVPKTTTANEKSPDWAGLLLRIYAIDCLVDIIHTKFAIYVVKTRLA